MFRRVKKSWAGAVAALAFFAAGADAQTLRIGLQEDPDSLDPTFAGSFVGRIVFAGLCDKLFDVDENLNIVPQLAVGHEWSDGNRTLTIRLRDGVVFHDGEPMDAEAVRFSLDRHLTAQGSFRRVEIAAVQAIEIVDRLTVRLRLANPFVPILAQFADRAGLIMSPRGVREGGPGFANRPICAGPFRMVERVAQDHITLERFPRYWDAANIHVERVTYRIIPDGAIRVANLQAGALDLIERVPPVQLDSIRRDNRMRLAIVDGVGYQGITFNLANGDRARAPIGADPRVREAFDLSIDRAIINQVVFNNEHAITGQPNSPVSPYHLRSIPAPPRNLERARALLRETGLPLPVVVNMMMPNTAEERQVSEVIQSMAREAGFDVRLQATEFAASLQAGTRGEFEAYRIGWSGRIDPDGNQTAHIVTGGPFNWGHYSNPDVDRLMNQARSVPTVEERRALYEQVMRIVQRDRPLIYLWHPRLFMAYTQRLAGFRAVPDGIIRFQGVRLAAN